MHRNRSDSSMSRARKQQTIKPVSILKFGEWNRRQFYNGGSFFCNPRLHAVEVRASSSTAAAVVESDEIVDVFFKETYPIRRTETVTFTLFDFVGISFHVLYIQSCFVDCWILTICFDKDDLFC